jgi:hypothetical protein
MRHYLKIPYTKKDEVKQQAINLGTRILWDPNRKLWYWDGLLNEPIPAFLIRWYTGETVRETAREIEASVELEPSVTIEPIPDNPIFGSW